MPVLPVAFHCPQCHSFISPQAYIDTLSEHAFCKRSGTSFKIETALTLSDIPRLRGVHVTPVYAPEASLVLESSNLQPDGKLSKNKIKIDYGQTELKFFSFLIIMFYKGF